MEQKNRLFISIAVILLIVIGIVISMLTAVTLTKFLLKQIVGFGVKNPVLYGLSRKGDK